MRDPVRPEDPEFRKAFYRHFRDFFDRAERKRRWSLTNDIPWDKVNRSMTPAVADVVESFCAIELYLPDYIAKALPMIRQNRGWSWFHANWGYEECKHSLALGDWLLKSGMRTDEQMADMEDKLFMHEWNLPHDSACAMLIYAMVQELATFLHYRNLKTHVDKIGDPALSQALTFIAVDERSHHAFYRDIVQMFLVYDRQATLEQLHRVLSTFGMPASHLLAESSRRIQQIKDMDVFNEMIFMRDVYRPLLDELGITRHEMRQFRDKKSA